MENFDGLPADLLDQYMAGVDTSDEEGDAPEDVESPEEDTEDTLPEAGSEEETEDTDEQEDEGDLDEEDEGEEGDEDEDEDDDSFLPEFDRKKFLQKHPELEPAYKHFQAAFTRKMQEVSVVQKQAEALQQDHEEFAQMLQSDEGCEEFLVQLALRRPEVFDSAFDKITTLNDDESEKKSYLLEQENKKLKAEREKQGKQSQQQVLQQRIQEVVSVADETAAGLGLTGAEVEVAHRFVAQKIQEARIATGNPDIPNEVVKAAVKEAASHLNQVKKQIQEKVERETRGKKLEAAKKAARTAKRGPAPKGRVPMVRAPVPQQQANQSPDAAIAARISQLLG
jgi:hypothetical protein